MNNTPSVTYTISYDSKSGEYYCEKLRPIHKPKDINEFIAPTKPPTKLRLRK
jgi:hypothetical protein